MAIIPSFFMDAVVALGESVPNRGIIAILIILQFVLKMYPNGKNIIGKRVFSTLPGFFAFIPTRLWLSACPRNPRELC